MSLNTKRRATTQPPPPQSNDGVGERATGAVVAGHYKLLPWVTAKRARQLVIGGTGLVGAYDEEELANRDSYLEGLWQKAREHFSFFLRTGLTTDQILLHMAYWLYFIKGAIVDCAPYGFNMAPRPIPRPPRTFPTPRLSLTPGNTEASTYLLKMINFFAFQPLLHTCYSQKKRRPPYPAYAMVAAIIIGISKKIGSARELADWLKKNPVIARECGFTFNYRTLRVQTPAHSTISAFMHRVGPRNLETVSEPIVENLGEVCPDFGKEIAADATVIKAYSNYRRKPHSDPDARLGYARKENGRDKFVFGYKAHIMVDTTPTMTPNGEVQRDIPITVEVGPATSSEKTWYAKQFIKTWNQVDVRVIIADAGYFSGKNEGITMKYAVTPIIDIPKGRGKHTPRPIQPGSKEWNDYLKKQRGSIERVNSRLKGLFNVERDLYVRGREQVEVHMRLRIITMQLLALAAQTANFGSPRAIVQWR
jgi:hypothetical protein